MSYHSPVYLFKEGDSAGWAVADRHEAPWRGFSALSATEDQKIYGPLVTGELGILIARFTDETVSVVTRAEFIVETADAMETTAILSISSSSFHWTVSERPAGTSQPSTPVALQTSGLETSVPKELSGKLTSLKALRDSAMEEATYLKLLPAGHRRDLKLLANQLNQYLGEEMARNLGTPVPITQWM